MGGLVHPTARGGLVLIGLSLLLLLVGGGFGPPLIGVIAGVAATRMGREGHRRPGPVRTVLARVWPWLLGAGLVGYLSLVPGIVLVSRFTGFDDPLVVAGLTVLSFTGLILALVAARAHDRLSGHEGHSTGGVRSTGDGSIDLVASIGIAE